MRRFTTTFALALALMATPAFADSLGRVEYLGNCAVCHGTEPGGLAPYAELLKVSAPDLTLLAKENNGVLPFERIYRVIDGRQEVKAHGPREMPIWGNVYNVEAAQYYADFYKDYDAEAFVRTRILALIDYLNTVQRK